MENLFDPASAAAVRTRIASLTPANQRQWGKMSAAQMLEHCARGVEMANGDLNLPRIFIGRVLGPIIKPLALKDAQPMKRNSPTAPSLLVLEDVDFELSRTRLLALYDRFASQGEPGCTTHPHPFFGPLTPAQWSKLGHKHLDHHLRQFGA